MTWGVKLFSGPMLTEHADHGPGHWNNPLLSRQQFCRPTNPKRSRVTNQA
jgi:hypothetical protein